MKNYRADIDGLRAVAVGAVLLFHCGVPGFPGGFVGVDVFFVISGFLITGHLASDIAQGRMSVARFYERRIRRIVPALFATLLLCWLAAALLLLPSFLLATSRALVAAALSVSNVFFWKNANYFAPDSAFQPLLHTWSLSVEEQFYLAVPVLMLLAARPLRQRWVWLFGPLCLASFALSVYATTRAPTANFYLLPTRAWELAIGSLLATAPLPAITRRFTAEAAGLAGLALILVPVFAFDEATAFPGLNALWPCLGAALLIHAGGAARPLATRLLSTRPFVALGLISFSLYLVHWPIVSLLRYRAVAPLTPGQVAGVLVASLALATLSWWCVERPFRRTAPGPARRGLVIGAGLAATGGLALLGLAGTAERGFPGRFPAFAEQAIPGHEQWKPRRCFLTGDPDWHDWSATECTRIATGPRRILLWGDSFAGQYVPGILATAEALHATVIQYTAAGCPPVLSYRSFARIRCADFNAHALDVIREQQIDLVVLSGRWTDMVQRGLGEVGSTLAALRRMGVPAVLVGQSPEFAADIQVISFLKGSAAPDAVNRWDVFFPPDINEQLRVLAAAGRFVDPMPALCQAATCTYQDHGTFLFEDYGHYSAEGSRRVVETLFVAHPERLAPTGTLAQAAP